jgi:hypothetical protein
MQMTCTCKGYKFPHRATSGKCLDDGSGMFCGACGEPCQATDAEIDVGAYEFWGRTGVDRNIQTVSHCCEATIYADASLTEEVTDFHHHYQD